MGVSFILSWTRAYNEAYRIFRITEDELAGQIADHLKKYRNIAIRAGYFSAVQRFLLSDDPETVIFSCQTALSYITDLVSNDTSCQNAVLYSAKGRYLYVNQGYLTDVRDFLDTSGFLDNIRTDQPFFQIYPGSGGKNVLLFVYPVYDVTGPSPANSMLCILICNSEAITSGLSLMEEAGAGATMLLFDGTVISLNENINSTDIPLIPAGKGYTTLNGVRYFTIRVPLPMAPWEYVYIIPQSTMTARVFSFFSVGIPLMCAVILLIILLLLLLMRSVNRGITLLEKNIDALEYGQSAPHYNGPRLIEIERVSRSVDSMLNRLDNAFANEQRVQRRLLEAVTAQARAEFNSYRAQINPHFLFNTLECMRAMAHNRREKEMESLVSSIAQIFRYSLYAKTTVPLLQELDHIRSFMNVINIRYGGCYRLNIIAGSEAEQHTVLSMSLQPLVENAVVHGLAGKNIAIKNITVQAFCTDGNLVVRITDNGCGISKEETEMLNRDFANNNVADSITEGANDLNHHALHNICRRMKLCFGGNCYVHIKSRKNFYTSVELSIPGKMELELPENREALCIEKNYV
ncbi:hypothetical protein FACS1894151_02010 [Spirochaetia bacterium]|nr:hypothetical protein FACS1894151_02010 [Spirochaetia bacterium]